MLKVQWCCINERKPLHTINQYISAKLILELLEWNVFIIIKWDSTHSFSTNIRSELLFKNAIAAGSPFGNMLVFILMMIMSNSHFHDCFTNDNEKWPTQTHIRCEWLQCVYCYDLFYCICFGSNHEIAIFSILLYFFFRRRYMFFHFLSHFDLRQKKCAIYVNFFLGCYEFTVLNPLIQLFSIINRSWYD